MALGRKRRDAVGASPTISEVWPELGAIHSTDCGETVTTLEDEKLDRMAKASFDRNMELCWPQLEQSYRAAKIDLSGVEHSWERQSDHCRQNWRETIVAAMVEYSL